MRRYTLRLSSDPRGRLRGGAACGLAEALAGGFIPPGAGPRTSSGGGALMTRTGCTFAGRVGAGPVGRGWPAGAVALAIPMNVAGDNMRVTYKYKCKQPVNVASDQFGPQHVAQASDCLLEILFQRRHDSWTKWA